MSNVRERLNNLRERDLSEWDLESVCYHEAAHVVVAQHFGLGASAEVFPRPNLGDRLQQMLWGGRTVLCGSSPGPGPSLAGTVAEALLREGPDVSPEWVAEGLQDALEDGVEELSTSDRAAAGAYLPDDLVQCACLVRHLWPEIRAEAEWLRKLALQMPNPLHEERGWIPHSE